MHHCGCDFVLLGDLLPEATQLVPEALSLSVEASDNLLSDGACGATINTFPSN
ncbi:MAG: hypothetical protein HOO08_10240 [Opitutae bacterium]|nr:hypothetical protein [Opitutae bacterium]